MMHELLDVVRARRPRRRRARGGGHRRGQGVLRRRRPVVGRRDLRRLGRRRHRRPRRPPRRRRPRERSRSSQCRKPVIAAINGPAVGVGITMTLPMDVRIVAEDAKIGFVFARRGIVPEACSSWFLPRIVGIAKATELCLTGRVFRARDEAASGLFNAVVPTARSPAARARDRARDRRQHLGRLGRAQRARCSGTASARRIHRART